MIRRMGKKEGILRRGKFLCCDVECVEVVDGEKGRMGKRYFVVDVTCVRGNISVGILRV